jgi:lipopolysaccharide/colanic/teichoic acid biosynthesis glycosyltransferase
MYERWGKRTLDCAGAALLLASLAPLMALVALAVLLALGRPVLYRQARAGRGGRPFVLLKFRSMAGGPGADAARLSRFGRALRASALDELPQLLNVLRGEMSLVGPRPLPPEYLALYTERQARRLRARPGLAGLAQAAGRNAVPWGRRLALDARYAARPSRFRADAAIALRCLGVVLRGRGASAPNHATMPAFRGGAPTASPARRRGRLDSTSDSAPHPMAFRVEAVHRQRRRAAGEQVRHHPPGCHGEGEAERALADVQQEVGQAGRRAEHGGAGGRGGAQAGPGA